MRIYSDLLTASVLHRTHTMGMYACTEELCEIYPKIHRDLLKNSNKFKKKKVPVAAGIVLLIIYNI